MHLGRNIVYECMKACCVSQSVIHQVLNASVGVFRNNVSLKKDKGYVITSERFGKNCCQIQGSRYFVIICVVY